MARGLPDPNQLREIKYGDRTGPEEQTRMARMLLEAGRIAEALDLFLLAGDEKGVAEMRERALREGRPLLLIMIERGGEREIGREEWIRAGDAAFADGRWREAFRCYTSAGNEEGLARVREHLPDYEIYVPQGKA